MGAPSLDYKRNNRNKKNCGGRAFRSVQVGDNGEKEFVYKRQFCKKWGCPRCGPIKAWQFCKDIPEIIEQKGLDRFLTLTLDPKKIPKDENRQKYIWKVWAKFRTYLKRKLKENISYICVLELHKSGLPHLHVLINRFIPQKWISKSWDAVGGGKIVFIEKAKDLKNIPYYLSKYLTKSIDANLPRYLRRISTSRDIKLNKFDKGEDKWELSPISMDMIEKLIGSREVLKKHDCNEILTEIRATFNIDLPEGLDYYDPDMLERLITRREILEHESDHISEGVQQRAKRTRLLYRSPEEIAEFVFEEFWAGYRERVRRINDCKEGRTDTVQSVGLFFEEKQGRSNSAGGEN